MEDAYVRNMLSILVDFENDDYIELLRSYSQYIKKLCKTIYDKIDKDILKVELDYKEHLSLNDSFELTNEFLNSINPEYVLKFQQFINNGILNINYNNENYVETFKRENDNTFWIDMNVCIKHNIDDVYCLVHEFFHTTNLGSFEFKFKRTLLTESVSIFYEFLLYDFLKNKTINQYDNEKSIYFRLYEIQKDSKYVFGYVNLLNKSLNSFNLLKEENNNYEDIEFLFKSIKSSIKYSVSGIMALIMYYKYKKGYIDLNNVFDYNNSITNNDYLDVLSEINEESIINSINYINEDILKQTKKYK